MAGEESQADLGVSLDVGEFFVGQPPRLAKHRIRHPDFSQVVKEATQRNARTFRFIESGSVG